MADKRIKALVRWLKRQGYQVELKKRSGHYRVKGPRGLTFMPSTPSDSRTYKNLRSQLRSIGIRVPPGIL